MSIVDSKAKSSPPIVARESPNHIVSQQSPHPVNDGRPQISMWWLAIPAFLLVLAIVALRPQSRFHLDTG